MALRYAVDTNVLLRLSERSHPPLDDHAHKVLTEKAMARSETR
jgi:predicted nucleic acid-binding protein